MLCKHVAYFFFKCFALFGFILYFCRIVHIVHSWIVDGLIYKKDVFERLSL